MKKWPVGAQRTRHFADLELPARAPLGQLASRLWCSGGVLGIVGSSIGGFIARLFSRPPPGAPFHPAGIILPIVGALIALWVWNRLAL